MDQGERRKFAPKINLSKACTTILIPHYLLVNVGWEQLLRSLGCRGGGKQGERRRGEKGRGKEKLECNASKKEISHTLTLRHTHTHTQTHTHTHSHSLTQTHKEREKRLPPPQVLTTYFFIRGSLSIN